MALPLRNTGLGALALVLVSAALSGCGAYATSTPKSALVASSGAISFGDVLVGHAAVQNVTVSNLGDTSVNISRAAISGRGFQLMGGIPSGAVAAGESMSLLLQFAPASFGVTTGDITLTSDGSDAALKISLRGTGARPGLNVSPGSLVFPDVPVGQSRTENVTLTNSGSGTVAINPATISGAGFTLSGLSAPANLAPGETILAAVKFAPTAPGPVTGAVSIASRTDNAPAAISLSGVGQQAFVSASTSNVSFGKVVVGDTNSQPITLRNSGNATLTFSQLAASGTGVSLTGLSTSTTIAPNSSVTFNAVFAPSSSSAVSGSITLVTNGVPSPLVIGVTGTGSGVQASLGLSPSSLNFSTVAEGSSKTLSSTLTNTGNSNIDISSVKVSGAGFSASGVSGGTILMPGQSTALIVTFSPSSVGSTTGASVTIASNAANSPAIVSLGGAGQAPASHRVALSWNPSSSSDVTGYNVFRAVNSGGYGTNPLNAAPVSGTGYTDASVTAGQTYFYIVTTVGSGVSSTASNEVAATIPTP